MQSYWTELLTNCSLNKFKTSEGDKDDDLEEDKADDDDFKPGLDFNDMKFDDSQKVRTH